MPGQNDTELISFEGWTVRVCPAALQPARLLVLIHGFKGDENSMWVFAGDLKPEYHMIAPRAPYPVVDGGFSWRPQQSEASGTSLGMSEKQAGPVPADEGPLELLSLETFEPAVSRLIQVVDAYAARFGLNAAQFDLMGFSQGGAISSLLALLHPQRVRKAAILASFLPKNVESLIAKRPLDGKPVFVAHGTRDERVPIEFARRTTSLLEQAGADITYCEDDVGHKLSARCLRALKSFLRD